MKQKNDILSGAFSSQRLEKYINLYNGDVAKVAAHYKANLSLDNIDEHTAEHDGDFAIESESRSSKSQNHDRNESGSCPLTLFQAGKADKNAEKVEIYRFLLDI